MTTHVEDVTTHVGLVIDGDVEAGGAGSYPVTNPARPAEVVLEAPSTSPEQLDRAVAAAQRAQPTWAAQAMEDRAATVLAAAEAGVAFAEANDLARLLTREHGKTHLEAIFDSATMAGMAAAFAPVVADALAAREVSGGTTRVEWVPHGVVAAILPFNWPVSVMANKVLPALLAGDTVVVKAPPTCPATVLTGGGCHGRSAPGGRAERGERTRTPRWAPHSSGIPGSTWSRSPAGWARARRSWPPRRRPHAPSCSSSVATTPPSLHPTWWATGHWRTASSRRRSSPRARSAWRSSASTCSATGWTRRSAALAERLAGEVVGDGLAEGVTMGPVHTASARDRVEAMVAEADGAGATVLRPGTVRAEDQGSGGYFVSPALGRGAAGRPPGSSARSSSHRRCR